MSTVAKNHYENKEKKSPEQQRIASIKANGGCHLKNFKKNNITYDMCRVAVKLDGEALSYVPEELRTKEIYEIAVKKTGRMLSRVPKKYITKKMCENAVASYGLAIEYVPNKFKTSDVCLIAASQNPLAMQKIPEKFITVEFVVKVIKKYQDGVEAVASLPKSLKNAKFYHSLIEECPEIIWKLPKAAHTAVLSKACLKAMKCKSLEDAVKKNPEFLSQVHPSLYDYDACKAFVTSDFFTSRVESVCMDFYSDFNIRINSENGFFYMDRTYDRTYSIPHMVKWPDICLALVKSNPSFIKYVNPNMITQEMYIMAVSVDKKGHIIKDIPLEFRTEELCMLALEKDPDNIEYIPEEYLNEEVCLETVKKRGDVLACIPEQFMNYDICLAAMAYANPPLKDVPEKLIDKKMCLVALEHNKDFSVLEEIPERLLDYELCLAAVKRKGYELNKVPDKFLTYELCLAAVQSGAYSLERIPSDYFTEELCLEILKDSAYGFEYIPKERLTEKICLQALQFTEIYHSVLREIPEEIVTQEMVNLSLEKSVWSFKDVPEKFVTEEMIIDVAKRGRGREIESIPTRLRTRAFLDRLRNEFGIGDELDFYKIEPID